MLNADAILNITTIPNLLSSTHALGLPKENRRRLFDDADWHRRNLMDGVSFIGETLENHACAERAAGQQVAFGNDSMEQLGRLLNSAMTLITALDDVMHETGSITAQGVSHV